jgi:hypothetical protein
VRIDHRALHALVRGHAADDQAMHAQVVEQDFQQRGKECRMLGLDDEAGTADARDRTALRPRGLLSSPAATSPR